MNILIEKENIVIEEMIYEIRGIQIMLSSDVAKLYDVETKVLNQTIKRNINRFPEEFCFQLSNEEANQLSSRSQFVTLNKNNNFRGNNIKYLPYVLTEQGIMMLSGLLKSDIAVKVNIQIINAFVKTRKYFANNLSNNDILINHESRLIKLENTFDKFKEKETKNKIFFEGELYDAYSVLLDILKTLDKKLIIVSKNIDEILKKKYKSQYNNITFINNSSFHDRFIILDRNKLYSCGASFKDLGKKCFAINDFNDKEYLNKILNILDN